MKRSLSGGRSLGNGTSPRATKKPKLVPTPKVAAERSQRKRKRAIEEQYSPPRTPTKRKDVFEVNNTEIFQTGTSTPKSQVKIFSSEKIWHSINSKNNSVLQTPIKSPTLSQDSRIRMTSRRALTFGGVGDDKNEKTPCSKGINLFQTLNVNSGQRPPSISSKNSSRKFENLGENQMQFLQNAHNADNAGNFAYGKQQMEIIEEGEEEEILKGEKEQNDGDILKGVKNVGKCVKNQISRGIDVLMKPLEQFTKKSSDLNTCNFLSSSGQEKKQQIKNGDQIFGNYQQILKQDSTFRNVHVQQSNNNINNFRRRSMGELMNTPSNAKKKDYFNNLNQHQNLDYGVMTRSRRKLISENQINLVDNTKKQTDMIKCQQNNQLAINNFPQQIYQRSIANQLDKNNSQIFNKSYNNSLNNNNKFTSSGSENFAWTLNQENFIQSQFSQNQSINSNNYQNNNNNNNQRLNLDPVPNFRNISSHKNFEFSLKLPNFGTPQKSSGQQKNSGYLNKLNEISGFGIDVLNSAEKKRGNDEEFKTPERLKMAPMDSMRDVAKFIRSRKDMFDSYAFNNTSDNENNSNR